MMDIGKMPKTVGEAFLQEVTSNKTVLWDG